jgi:hypothetical protein
LPEHIKRWNRTYEQIETSCRTTNHCVPCTYPSCQRSVKLKKNVAHSFGKAGV